MNAPSFPEIGLLTPRLLLRPFAPEDAEALHRLINDFEVCRNLAGVPFPYPRALADDWIAASRRALAGGTALHLAITAREGEGGLLGGIGLHLDPSRGRIGYWVARRFWGRGIAREALARVLEWAFATHPLEGVEAVVAADNAASIALLHRLGFRHAGFGRRHFLARNAELRVLHFERRRTPADAPATAAGTQGSDPPHAHAVRAVVPVPS
jgi:8-oxo-dGTP diphosphatase